MARQQFRKHNTTTNKEQMARQQMMTQSNVGFSFSVHVSRCDPLITRFLFHISRCHPWRHQISFPRVPVPPLDVTKFLFYASWCHPLTSLGTISAHTSSQMLQIYMFKLCVFFCRRVHLLCVPHAPNFGFNLLLSLVHVICCFVVVISCCHLSFVVAIRMFYCLRHFRLSTLFVFVCTCVRTGMCVAGGFQSH